MTGGVLRRPPWREFERDAADRLPTTIADTQPTVSVKWGQAQTDP